MSDSFIPENTKRALDEINKNSELLNKYGFYLAGGTALAFKLKYRISYDLDFFTKMQFDPNELLNSIRGDLEISDIKVEKRTLKFNYLNTDFSFFYYPYDLLIHSEDLVTQNFNYKIKVANILDIALMKITAIAGRGLEKDFADLYYSSLELGGIGKVMDNFEKKFPKTNFEHYLKSLVYFDDADSGPRPNILIKEYNWEQIKNYFQKEVTKYINLLQKSSEFDSP